MGDPQQKREQGKPNLVDKRFHTYLCLAPLTIWKVSEAKNAEKMKENAEKKKEVFQTVLPNDSFCRAVSVNYLCLQYLEGLFCESDRRHFFPHFFCYLVLCILTSDTGVSNNYHCHKLYAKRKKLSPS